MGSAWDRVSGIAVVGAIQARIDMSSWEKGWYMLIGYHGLDGDRPIFEHGGLHMGAASHWGPLVGTVTHDSLHAGALSKDKNEGS